MIRYRWAAQFAHGRRVLDAGCGTAHGTVVLAGAGARSATGVDLDEQAVRQATRLAPAGIELLVADLRTLPFADGSFDLITCFGVLHHVEEPGRMLDELRRVLGPSGMLIVSSAERTDELGAALGSRFEHIARRRQLSVSCAAIIDDRRDGDGVHEDAELRGSGAAPNGAEWTITLAGHETLPTDHPVLVLDGQLAAQHETLAAQQQQLEAQAAVLGQLSQRDRNLQYQLGQASIEVAELRRALLGAENDLAGLRQLEADFNEVTALLERLRTIEADRDRWLANYEVVVNSSSWRLTAPLRDVTNRLRQRRT
jgi:SAM-dependent methyltransferase